MTDIRKHIEQIAAEADATNSMPMPTDAVASRPNKSVTVGVRLALDDAAAIEAMADRLDIPVSALLRGWIVAALAANRKESITTAIDRIALDVQRLRELVS